MPYFSSSSHGNGRNHSEDQPTEWVRWRYRAVWGEPPVCILCRAAAGAPVRRRRCLRLSILRFPTKSGGAPSKTRWHTGIRLDGRARQLRLPRQHLLRVPAPGGAALFDPAQIRPGELPADRRRSGAILGGLARPPDVHLQIASERIVSRRVATDLG